MLTVLPVYQAQEQILHSMAGVTTSAMLAAAADSLGKVVAEQVVSPEKVPSYARSTMDGFAVRSEDTFGATDSLPSLLLLKGKISMGVEPEHKLGSWEAMEISTGGMLPEGSDSVVMLEYCEVMGDQVAVCQPTAPLENIISAGEDYNQGDEVLVPGHKIRAQDLGILAALGITGVRVYSPPRVVIFSTGDEVVSPDQSPNPGQIRDVNGPTLSALVRETGGIPDYRGIIPDSHEALEEGLLQVLDNCDLVLVSGGSSVGTRDVTARVMDQLPGNGVLFHGVSMRPGKPLIYGVGQGKPVFGLSGNPVSAIFGFLLFVRPLLRQLQGLQAFPAYLPYVEACLDTNFASQGGREDYVRVMLDDFVHQDKETAFNDLPGAKPVFGGPGLLNPVVKGDGYFVIPRDVEGLDKGSRVKVFLW